METGETKFKVGDLVKISPNLTSLNEWITAIIIKIRENPFVGTEIAAKDTDGRIFFGEKVFFEPSKDKNLCTQ